MLGQGYDQSKEEIAIKIEQTKRRLENIKTKEEAEAYMKEYENESKEVLQELLDYYAKIGLESNLFIIFSKIC